MYEYGPKPGLSQSFPQSNIPSSEHENRYREIAEKVIEVLETEKVPVGAVRRVLEIVQSAVGKTPVKLVKSSNPGNVL